MIIGRGKGDDGEELLLMGSRQNIDRLCTGRAIHIRRVSHGDSVPEGWEILLFVGETEESMRKMLERKGFIGEDTRIIRDKRLGKDDSH